MPEIKTYQAHGSSHTGSTGFTNRWPGTCDDISRALAEVFAAHPGAVVVDGDDDWCAQQADRPMTWRDVFDVKPLAWFHSQISGISVSGIVLARADFDRIQRAFPEVMGSRLRERPRLRIYEE